MKIASARGPYTVRFAPPFAGLAGGAPRNGHLLIDARVARLYARRLGKALSGPSVLRIEASEEAKSLEALPRYARHLIERGVRRDHCLVAVGGGVVLELAAFLAGTLLRGLKWRCYPTTLLAQADACVGGKSSLNVGPYKNQMGTITPPSEVVVSPDLLSTLPDAEFRSGMGEVIKAHIVMGWPALRALSRKMRFLREDRKALENAVRLSLDAKKRLVEEDEFEGGARLLLNYGHTFGHAIESATGFRVPHGIAVTIGMDMANQYSALRGLTSRSTAGELRAVLAENIEGLSVPRISVERCFSALRRDKKEVGGEPRLVLLREPGKFIVRNVRFDTAFRRFCRDYFRERPLFRRA